MAKRMCAASSSSPWPSRQTAHPTR